MTMRNDRVCQLWDNIIICDTVRVTRHAPQQIALDCNLGAIFKLSTQPCKCDLTSHHVHRISLVL